MRDYSHAGICGLPDWSGVITATRTEELARRALARLPEPVAEAMKRLARRAAGRPEPAPRVYETRFLERPVGAKFELTHRCNLMCGFCYTDSPVVTRSHPHELDDDQWLAVVDQTLELGIVEAVVSGGEPFFRKSLTLDVVERLSSAGTSVILNTNGWFVDDRTADRLGANDGLIVVVSVDGVTPEEHDHARGVAGSWFRAVSAVDRLIQRGVAVRVNHVVTPDNLDRVEDFMEAMWGLGVRSLRVTAVGPTGSATRGGDWGVDRRVLESSFARFCVRHGSPVNVRLSGPPDIVERIKDAPRTILVKPDGAVLVESGQPFAFGNVVDDGVRACWENLGSLWTDRRIIDWAADAASGSDSAVVPYRDPDVFLAGTAPPAGGEKVPAAEVALAPVGPAPAVTPATVTAARSVLRNLVLARRHRLGDLRWSGDRDGDRYVRLRDGTRATMNAFASLVMDAADGATVREAAAALCSRLVGADPTRVEDDVVATVDDLRVRGILVPVPSAPDASARSRIPVAAAP